MIYLTENINFPKDQEQEGLNFQTIILASINLSHSYLRYVYGMEWITII